MATARTNSSPVSGGTSRVTPSAPSGGTHAGTGTAIIEARGLTKRYRGHVAVDGIDLVVRTGEIFGILGPNGAGKTTTLEMIEGLRKPDSGTITVAGIDAVRDSDRVREIIGVQLQTTALFPYLTARELIDLFGNLYNLPHAGDRAPELLRLVGLEDKAGARVDELSGGQKQRLSIALALVNRPKVTFLDEPTTGLDPHARRNLWQTVLGVREAGTTVVLTTHYMEEAEVLCDRIAVMDNGRVIACDTPAGLIRSLDLEAVVSATLPNGAGGAADGAKAEGRHNTGLDGRHTGLPLHEVTLAAIPGVSAVAVHDTEAPPRITLQTRDTQATIVGLLALAGEQGVTLGELSSTRATLEDVFLNLTGRSYAEEDAPPGEASSDDGRGRKRRRRRGGS